MSRLSIFSSETLRLDPRKLLPTILLTAVFFALVDTALRFSDPLKTYGGWENPYVEFKIDRARKIRDRHGRIDVMLFSSSIGLQTEVSLWQEACGGDVICYNAAIGGSRPQWSRFLFENVYYPETKPSHVIYCVSPRDVNTCGTPAAAYRHMGVLWKSFKSRSYLAATLKDKFFIALEKASYLFRVRGHIRRYIQQGPIPQDTLVMTEEDGTNLPTVRALPEKMAVELGKKDTYRKFSMPEDGEIAELIAMNKFCRERGVEFVVVNQQVAPVTFELFDNKQTDYQKYLDGLKKVEAAGVRVVYMAEELKLTNRHFGDGEHLNRWGGHLVTDYIYRKIVRPWFPEKALVAKLPEWLEVPFASLLSQTDRHFFTQNRSKIPPTSLYAAPLEAVTYASGGKLPIRAEFPPGDYVVHLYGADERTTRTEGAPGHKLAWEVESKMGGTREIGFEMSRRIVQGAALTKMDVSLDVTSSLALAVKQMAGAECVLDSVFFREKIKRGATPERPLPDVVKGFAAPDPMLVRNHSFEFLDPRIKGYPVEWQPYTRERQPWGYVDLDRDAHTGEHAVRLRLEPKTKGWGCMIVQDVAGVTLDQLRGKRVTVSVWVKSERGRFDGKVDVVTSAARAVKFPEYQDRGKWQKLAVEVDVDPLVRWMSITLGALTAEPVLVDDVFITVGQDQATTSRDAASSATTAQRP